jgi:polysaccharide export outer membrane protein
MFKIQLYIISFISLSLFTQEFDNDFLNSLTPEMRAQLSSEVASNQNSREAVNLGPPSTAISQDDIQNDTDQDPAGLVFGLDFFNTIQSTFMPINEPTTNPDYILGSYDSIKLQLVGQKNIEIVLNVNRDGSINIPELGLVNVAGLPFREVQQLITNKINNSFIGVDAFITLDSIRDIQILVSGEVNFPGIYTLPGGSTLLNALISSGGPKETGDLRNIKVIRGSETIKSLDLYDALIFGNFKEANFILNPGDTVFLSRFSKQVRIQGGVNRPGIYQLKDSENYEDLLGFAQNYSPWALKENIKIISFSSDSFQNSFVDNESIKSYKLLNNDNITIPEIKRINISVIGAVKQPGSFEVPDGFTVLDAINLARGFEENAYPFGGVLLNQKAADMQTESILRIRQDLLSAMSQRFSSTDQSMNITQFLEQYDSVEALGRVSAEFDIDKLRNSSELNLALNEGDEIIIPKFLNVVYVYGEVKNPGTYIFKSEKDAFEYINSSGGLTSLADKSVLLIHPNGESELLGKSSLVGLLSSKQFVYPGTLIYIPREFDLSAIETANVYLPIVSNLAVTLASIASINRN